MITVYADKTGDKYRLLVEGHADKTRGGSIVCAAVSALAGALSSFAASRAACRYLRVSEERGRLFLSCRGGLENAFEMTVEALALLAASYPEHIAPVKIMDAVDDKPSGAVL